MLLIGYLQGIRSERRLCEEVRPNLAYRWFCRLGIEGRVPDHSTFSKNRHGRLRDGEIHRLLFAEVVRACAAAGLIVGRDVANDASAIEAGAGARAQVPRPRGCWGLGRAREPPGARVSGRARRRAAHAPDERDPSPPMYASPTDPEAAWSVKHGPGRFSYAANYFIT